MHDGAAVKSCGQVVGGVSEMFSLQGAVAPYKKKSKQGQSQNNNGEPERMPFAASPVGSSRHSGFPFDHNGCSNTLV